MMQICGEQVDIKVETQIKLDKLKLRPYQKPIAEALQSRGFKKIVAIMPRRSGKDMTALQLAMWQCLKKVCVVYYIFPTYSQGRKILWDSITNDGQRVLDLIPSELIESKNGQEMKIRFINGSLLQIVGSDNVDSIVGTNPYGVIFSEYALQDPRAYQFIRPILTGNDGWALFISTPRGKNHLWEMYNIALHSDEWFAYKLSVLDTGHISLHEIEKERAEGLMSDDLIEQEYFCSFELGVEGAYYTKYIDKMRLKGQIGVVPWESSFKVHTAWDLGVRDSTVIIFFQIIGQVVRIIDYYEKDKEGLEYYIKILESKPYVYGKHFAPHDIKVREFTSGMSRIDKARQLGVSFIVAPDLSIMDGIEAVRSTLSKVWIDEVNCKDLIKSLENYRQEYDPKRKVYKNAPLHDKNSHAADAMRYLAISLPKTHDGSTPAEIEKRYIEAVYGDRNSGFFSDNSPNY
jgi:phage terminase large subunit